MHPEGRKISDKQEILLRTLLLDGVYLAQDSKRYYPYGDYLSHFLGFTGIDNQGVMGLELCQDDKLGGVNGSLSSYSDAKGGTLDGHANIDKPPEDGLH